MQLAAMKMLPDMAWPGGQNFQSKIFYPRIKFLAIYPRTIFF